MVKFEKFLFFYSILMVTVLLISFGIFEPSPLNLILVTLLVPTFFYFWVRLTNPEKVNIGTWSFRFIISLIILSGLGIFGFYLTKQSFLKPPAAETEQKSPVPSALPTITPTPQPTRNKTQGESVTDLVFGTPSPIPLQEVTGKPGVTLIDVYESPIQASKKLKSLSGSAKYVYYTKQGNWYNIVVSGSEAGWVSANQVQEVQ